MVSSIPNVYRISQKATWIQKKNSHRTSHKIVYSSDDFFTVLPSEWSFFGYWTKMDQHPERRSLFLGCCFYLCLQIILAFSIRFAYIVNCIWSFESGNLIRINALLYVWSSGVWRHSHQHFKVIWPKYQHKKQTGSSIKTWHNSIKYALIYNMNIESWRSDIWQQSEQTNSYYKDQCRCLIRENRTNSCAHDVVNKFDGLLWRLWLFVVIYLRSNDNSQVFLTDKMVALLCVCVIFSICVSLCKCVCVAFSIKSRC